MFVFSDIFELNRQNITEGKSVIITIQKNFNDHDQRVRINVKKIIPLDDILNKPINNIKIKINNFKEFDRLSKILEAKGDVEVVFEVNENNKKYTLKLKNKRFVDKNVLDSIKNKGISALII